MPGSRRRPSVELCRDHWRGPATRPIFRLTKAIGSYGMTVRAARSVIGRPEMSRLSWKTWSVTRWAPLFAVLVASAAMAGTAQASTAATSPAGLTFNGNFTGLSPWPAAGAGAQCANYGTPSQSPRLRGSLNFVTNVAGMANAGEITLPANSNTSTFPLEACDLLPSAQPIGLGTDGYYGLMVYVPQGWTISNNAFDGVEIEEYHFQNVYGAPISFQLHADHITMALQTGACNNHTTSAPGCTYHSNADNPNGNPGNLPASGDPGPVRYLFSVSGIGEGSGSLAALSAACAITARTPASVCAFFGRPLTTHGHARLAVASSALAGPSALRSARHTAIRSSRSSLSSAGLRPEPPQPDSAPAATAPAPK